MIKVMLIFGEPVTRIEVLDKLPAKYHVWTTTIAKVNLVIVMEMMTV